MSTSESFEDSMCSDSSPLNVENEANKITRNLLPAKSNDRYMTCYNQFMDWKTKHKIQNLDENAFLIYFNELSKTLKPNSLWSRWSMIKSVCYLYLGININTFSKLKMFIKNKAKGYQTKKAKTLTWEEIERFINNAPDDIYLAMKVILIFGISGALRLAEIQNIRMNDIQDTTTQLIVTVKDTKNCYPRSFIIGELFYHRVKQYMSLRPQDIDTDRLFIYYFKSKCTRSVIGKNKIAEVPRNIACYLNLPDPNQYTGHCFRRSSTTLLANSGANLTTIKEHGGWRSSTVAEGYIEHSLHNKKKIFNKITNTEQSCTIIKDLDATASEINNQNLIPKTNSNTIKLLESNNNEKRPLISTDNFNNILSNKQIEKPTSLMKNGSDIQKIYKQQSTTTQEKKVDNLQEIINNEDDINNKNKVLEPVNGSKKCSYNSNISEHCSNVPKINQPRLSTINIGVVNDSNTKNKNKNDTKTQEETTARINIHIDRVEKIIIYYGKKQNDEE